MFEFAQNFAYMKDKTTKKKQFYISNQTFIEGVQMIISNGNAHPPDNYLSAWLLGLNSVWQLNAPIAPMHIHVSNLYLTTSCEPRQANLCLRAFRHDKF